MPMTRPRLLRLLSLGVAACAGACSSVDWQPPPTPDVTWRDASLRVGDACAVVAVDAGEAEEVYTFFEELLAAMDEAGVERPEPTLLVAVEADFEPLFDDVDALQQAIERWHDDPLGTGMLGRGRHREEVPFEMVAPMVVLAPPIDAPELDLPEQWRQLYGQALVVPSETVRRDVMGRMIDLEMEQRDIGFGERLLFHSMWPIVSGRIYARMRREHQKQAARLLLRRRGLDERVLERVEAALGEEPIEPLDPEELRRAVDAKGS